MQKLKLAIRNGTSAFIVRLLKSKGSKYCPIEQYPSLFRL